MRVRVYVRLDQTDGVRVQTVPLHTYTLHVYARGVRAADISRAASQSRSDVATCSSPPPTPPLETDQLVHHQSSSSFHAPLLRLGPPSLRPKSRGRFPIERSVFLGTSFREDATAARAGKSFAFNP